MEKESELQQQQRLDEVRAQCESDAEQLKAQEDKIASLQRLLSLFTTPLSNDTDETARLRTIITRLLAKNEELRHGMSADRRRDLQQLKELRDEKEKRKLVDDFEPHYEATEGQVMRRKIHALELRVAELEAQVGVGKPVVIVTDAELKKEMDDCVLLRSSFTLDRDVMQTTLDAMTEDERAKYKQLLWDCWVGQDYLIHRLETDVLVYKMAHSELGKRLNQERLVTPEMQLDYRTMWSTLQDNARSPNLYLVTRATTGVAYGQEVYLGFVCSAKNTDWARLWHPSGKLELQLANQCSIDEWDARSDWVKHQDLLKLNVLFLGADTTGLGSRVILADYNGELRQ